MEFRFSMNEFGRSFATRGCGEELRIELATRAVEHKKAVIDFADVSNITYSFADEFLAKAVVEGGLELEVENAIPSVAGTLNEAVERREGHASALAR